MDKDGMEIDLSNCRADLRKAVAERDAAMDALRLRVAELEDELTTARKGNEAIVHDYGTRLHEAKAASGAMRAALEWVEWEGNEKGTVCVFCGGTYSSGHALDCQLRAALATGTGKLEAEVLRCAVGFYQRERLAGRASCNGWQTTGERFWAAVAALVAARKEK